MRVIVSGGGTGGHIYPALTLIHAIQKKCKDFKVLYVGTKVGLEADIVPKAGIDFETIRVRGLERKLSMENVTTIVQSVQSLWTARKIVKSFAPDLAIGTGGYVCGPILLAASLLKVPTMIQEQNVIPGITNKILSKFVDRIAVGYEAAALHFPAAKAIYTGNPIRSDVMTADRTEALKALGLQEGKKTILISGGSRGARSINQAMLGVHKHFAGRDGVQLLHVTGKNEYNAVLEKLQRQSIDLAGCGNIMIKPYLYDMPKALAAADLAVFRAGAIGLAELTARGIPSILIPYPYAAENHQEHNALALKRAGAAEMVLDRDLNAEKLIGFLEDLLCKEGKLLEMAKASKALGRPEAAGRIAGIAIELAAKKR